MCITICCTIPDDIDSQDSSADWDPLRDDLGGGGGGGTKDEDGAATAEPPKPADAVPENGTEEEDVAAKPAEPPKPAPATPASPAKPTATPPATPASPATPSSKWKNCPISEITINTILCKADDFKWEELHVMGTTLSEHAKSLPTPKGGWKTPTWLGMKDKRGCKPWRSFTKKTKVHRAHDVFHDASPRCVSRCIPTM